MQSAAVEERRLGPACRLAAAAMVFLLAVAAVSAGGPGSAGMQVLKSDISPRAFGMGGAFAAVADDIYTINYNPAGLGQLYIPEASAMYLSCFQDSTLQYFSYGMPLPILGFAGIQKPAVAISLLMSGAGTFDYNQILPGGGIYSKSYDAQKDTVLTLGYGEKVYSGDVNIEGYNARIEQYLGVNAKYIRSVLLEDKAPPSTFAFDAGWLAMEPRLGLSFAASAANYGGGLKYATETTKLPSILRLGTSYQHPTVLDQTLLLAAECDLYTTEALKSYRFGLEYNFQQMFSLRLGYRSGEDNSGLTMGLGVKYGDMSLDFATGMGDSVYNASQMSFSYKFSGITVKEYRRKMKYAEPEEPGQEAPKAAPARKTAPSPEKKKDSDFFWIY
jgi:hypothetical protein